MRANRAQAGFSPLDLVQDGAAFTVGDAWTGMANMRNRAAAMELAAGETNYCAPLSGPPKWAIAVVSNGIIYMLYTTAAGVFVTDGVGHFNVTPTSGWIDWPAGLMTGGIFNGYAVFNHPARPPWYWDGTLVAGAVKPLPGFLVGTQGKVLAPFGSHIFCGSLASPTEMLERLAWSDAAPAGSVPASWTPTATNQAGDIVLSTGAGPIRVMLGLGSQLMVYRTSGCWGVTYSGRPYIYTARKLSAEVGAASCNAVAEVRGSHVVLAPGDIVITDGTSMRSIGEGRVKETIFSQLSELGLQMSHVYAVPGSGEVVFNFAVGQEVGCNLAYVWNHERDKWSVRDQPMLAHSFATFAPDVSIVTTWANDAGTWATDATPWDAAPPGGFQARAVGVSTSLVKAFLLDEGDNDQAGQPVDGLLERLSLPLGDPTTVKLMTRIIPRLDGFAGAQLSVQVGSQVSAGDPVTFEAARPWVMGQTRHVDCLRVGRFLSLRIGGAPGSRWSCSGFTVEFEERAKQ
jgi:hypothetical protein